MSKQTRVSHPIYNLLPTEIEGFDSLAELALDMHWSWNHATDEVWRQLDPELWEITHNPWVVLQTVSRDQIERVLADPIFRKNVDGLVEASRQAAAAPAWFQRNHSEALLTCVAYFSMEFMLSMYCLCSTSSDDGCGGERWCHQACDVWGEPPRLPNIQLQTSQPHRTATRFSLAHHSGSSGTRADRHLQPILLRRGADRPCHREILRSEGLPDEPRDGKTVWRDRYRSIADLENQLHVNGTRIIKFFLHLSKEEQRKRFLARIDEPAKNWKFSLSDIAERKFWKHYMKAYEQCLGATNTRDAPWYVVPADDKDNARLIVSRIVLDTLEELKMTYPMVSAERRRELLSIRERLAK